jgi:hypothetical protein
MNRGWRAGRIALGLLLASVVVIVGLAELAYHRVHDKAFAFEKSVARTGESIRRHSREFLDDQAYSAGLPLFTKRSGTRDAGSVIGPRIHWVRVKPGGVEYAALSDRAIDHGLFEKLGEDWPHAAPELWSDVDFSWTCSARPPDGALVHGPARGVDARDAVRPGHAGDAGRLGERAEGRRARAIRRPPLER